MNWKWRVAVALWLAAILSMFLPGVSEASVMDFGELRFRFSDMLTLVAVGFAWGDLRSWRKEVDRRLGQIEKSLEAE